MFSLFFDGACEPINPGGTASYGWVIKKDGKTILSGSGVVGRGEGMTNNIGEYHGLIEGLKAYLKLIGSQISVLSKEKKRLIICGDSRLVCNMVGKKWGWNKKKTRWQPHKKMPHLRRLLDQVMTLLNGIDYQVIWVPREENRQADNLSKKAIFG